MEHIDSNTDSDYTNGGRVARGIGSKKHLRKGDADRVASYFLNGGPLVGHSHFVGAANPNCDSNDANNLVGIGTPHVPAYVPEAPPVYPYTYGSPYSPIVGQPNPTVAQSTNNWQSPFNNLVGSVLHPHPNNPGLPSIPHMLLRTASLPFHGIAHAHSIFKHLFSPPIVGSPNIAQGNVNSNESCLNGQNSYLSDKIPTNADASDPLIGSPNPTSATNFNSPNTYFYYPNVPVNTYHPQPSGYIVKVVPHVPSTNQVIQPPTKAPDETNDEPSTTEEPQSEKSSTQGNEKAESENTTKIEENIVNNGKSEVAKREEKISKKVVRQYKPDMSTTRRSRDFKFEFNTNNDTKV